jgi:pyocin large subunit-like protein
VVRNTGWVSIGVTGFSHAPIVQVTMAQQAKPEVELISIAATFERLAITV